MSEQEDVIARLRNQFTALERDLVSAPGIGMEQLTPRRFPPSWTVVELSTSYVMRDDNGQKLAYVHFEDEPRRRSAAKMLTKDEALRNVANIAKLPDLLRKD